MKKVAGLGLILVLWAGSASWAQTASKRIIQVTDQRIQCNGKAIP